MATLILRTGVRLPLQHKYKLQYCRSLQRVASFNTPILLTTKRPAVLYRNASNMPSIAPMSHSKEETWSSIYKTFEDQLFRHLSDDQEFLSLPVFIDELTKTGLRLNDPRLERLQKKIAAMRSRHTGQLTTDRVSHAKFKELICDSIVLLHKAFTNDMIIPEFNIFMKDIEEIYTNCRNITAGKVADYIPQLSRFSPDYWGVSACTVDGQRDSIGDTNTPFCLQSCSKPLTYALALSELGSDVVHQYVGQEPSGEMFNHIKLDYNNKPHNPMINAGAIVVSSLIRSAAALPDRFEFISSQYKRMAGGEYLGFNNSVCLSERETADRNFALGYYLRENKCFPEGTNLNETLDLYFQMCSIEMTCDSASVIAATLANGGICPITGERVLDPDAVRNTLSLMYSCGMYNYSGQFAFKVGLPAKSGVSGAVLLVIPNTMGICTWSPPLDMNGNSVRGIEFAQELLNRFNFHNYDNLRHTLKKEDPRKRHHDVRTFSLMQMLFGASNGDVTSLRRLALKGEDMGLSDYDGRTPLHVASAEGHLECVKFLLDTCNVPHSPKDRWGHTPLGEAKEFGHTDVIEYLKKKGAQDTDDTNPDEGG